MSYSDKLQSFLQHGSHHVWVVPRADPFLGEYVAPYHDYLPELTNFTGSAGMLFIAYEKTCLYVDGRYTIQAQRECDNNVITILDPKEAGISNIIDTYYNGYIIHINAYYHNYAIIKNLQQLYGDRVIVETQYPYDALWYDRPSYILYDIQRHDVKFAGQESINKIAHICSLLKQHHYDAIIIAMSDTLCWLLNIRGNDVPYNPIIHGYALLYSNGDVALYRDGDLDHTMLPNNVPIKHYQLHELPMTLSDHKGQHFCYDEQRTIYYIIDICKKNDLILHHHACFVNDAKSIKNNTEIAGTTLAHIHDGVALAHALCEIEDNYETLDECAVSDILTHYRQQQQYYQQPSFDTIAGMNAHGAIIHYRATPDISQPLQHGTLLIDSGAQYLNGTTDITRTIHLGNIEPTSLVKQHFTAVLRGHIALASQYFPKNTTGAMLDVVARQYLWNLGLDYPHGTGHGVGVYMNVHEGPQSISSRSHVPLRAGMVLSNEPGFYLEHYYGIRIENLVVIKEHTNGYLYFETLSLCPIDTALIDKKMIDEASIVWLNRYHHHVYKTLSPHISGPNVKEWLRKKTVDLVI